MKHHTSFVLLSRIIQLLQNYEQDGFLASNCISLLVNRLEQTFSRSWGVFKAMM